MTDLGLLIQRADRAAAAGDVAAANSLLRMSVTIAPDEFELWVKLAATARAMGDFAAALDATYEALRLNPLDFTALLMRANLAERLGRADADEAYDHALAQRPIGDPPAHLAAVIAHAERRVTDHRVAREDALASAMAPAELQATSSEIARIARFRSNVVRRTKVYHADPTHFHYPGLLEQEFHDRQLFSWITQFEAATEEITSEFRTVMASERSEFVPYIQYPAHEPLRQWQPLNNSLDWTAIHLLRNGVRNEVNARHCPLTIALLETLPQPQIEGCSPNAMFSLLAPGTTIPPHTGVANTRLVCHLPLIVPDGCWFRVGAETRCWRRGEAFVFDDTIEHEACNPSNELRVVFIFDMWHPGLSDVERDAVRRLMEADNGVMTAL